MFRYAYVGGMAVICCMLFCSCLEEQPTSPFNPQNYHPLILQITRLDSVVNAQEGELYPAAFEVIITNEAGLSLEDIPVVLTVSSGPGSVAPEYSLSDSIGVVHSLFYVNIPGNDTVSVVRAYAGCDSTDFTVYINSDPNQNPDPAREKNDAYDKFMRMLFRR